MSNYRMETKCVQSGYTPKNGEPRILPIYQSTTFKYENADQMGRLFDLEEDGYFYIIGAGTAKAPGAENTAKPGDARRVNALLKERLNARGGGSAQMVQGSIRAPKEEILAALN